MAHCLYITKPLSESVTDGILLTWPFETNFCKKKKVTQNSNIFIEKNIFENVDCEMLPISCQP